MRATGIDLAQGKAPGGARYLPHMSPSPALELAMPQVAARPTSEPGSAAEREAFARLQERLPALFRRVFPYPKAPRSVVIVPSLTLDQEVLAKITGVAHYEERFLCLLLMLRWPRTRIIYVTSTPIAESIIDYYLHLLPDVPMRQARRRLTLLTCDDPAPRPLTAKILEQPLLLAQLDAALEGGAGGGRADAHMTCFNVTALERSLAVRLGVPIYGCDPALQHHGSKSGSRKLFKQAGVALPAGFEDLADGPAVAEALTALKARDPGLRRAVVKLNEGFSGEGNAVFSFKGAPDRGSLAAWTRDRLPALAFEARDMNWEAFGAKIVEMGAIVEAFIEGEGKRSPSAQYRIDPLGQVEAISTHDQIMGGQSDQIFLGCRFPADESYRLEIQAQGLKAAEALRNVGVLGRFGVDFISAPMSLGKGGRLAPLRHRSEPAQGRYDPSLPDAAVSERRQLRSGKRPLPHAGWPAALLRRLRQPGKTGISGIDARCADRTRGAQRLALSWRHATGRGFSPAGRPPRIRQARPGLRRRQP